MSASPGQSKMHGLFRLHPPSYVAESCNVDLVAIHGLGGHALNTWTDKGDHLWLRDSLPRHIPGARIMTFGYDSAVLFARSRMNVNDFAVDLLTRLRLVRQRPEEKARPLVFVCHSLGGVVFKETLIQATLQSEQFDDMAKRISGVMFMGTPHRGSRTASLARNLSRIINTVTLGRGVRTALLDTLQVSSADLETISRHATQLLKPVSIVSFYETKPLGPSLIVEPFSAVLGLPNERAIPINASHTAIGRVSPRKAHRYLPVWTSLKELVEASLIRSPSDSIKLMDTLFCSDYKTAQLRPRQAHRGTCSWIFTHPAYDSWFHLPGSGMLLLSGGAGTGKSVMTRYLTESIMAGSEEGVLAVESYTVVSFFCSYHEHISNEEGVVVRSILHQLIQLNPRCEALVRNRLQIRTRDGVLVYSLDEHRLWGALREVFFMETMKHTFIAIDAIEELGTEAAVAVLLNIQRIIKALNEMRPEHRVRIFLSSRHDPAYNTKIPSLTVLRFPRKQITQNIELFLTDNVNAFAAANSSFDASTDSRSRRRIVEAITGRADAMFLWANIAFENFQRGLFWSPEIVVTKLAELDAAPFGLNALYDKMIDQVDEAVRDDMWSILSILSAAARPLKEAELSIILGIAKTRRGIVSSSDISAIGNLGAVVNTHLPDLISVHDDFGITLVHLSFEEYLRRRWETSSPEILMRAKRMITRACLKYIQLKDLLLDASLEATLDQDSASKYPFFNYAKSFYMSHLRQIPYDDSLWLLFADTAKESSLYDSAWARTTLSPLENIIHQLEPSPAKMQLIRDFVDHGYDINERWRPVDRRGAPFQRCLFLLWLNERGTEEVAFLLLKLGADPNLPEGARFSNLKYVVRAQAWPLYEALIAHPKINLDAQDDNGQYVLHYLVQDALVDKLSNLLDNYPVDVNIQDISGFTPLHLATSNNNIDIVRELLGAYDIRLDIMDKQGRTPLTLATYWGLQRIALCLIEPSQAFPMPDRDHLSSIVFAAKHGDKDLCLRLLELSRYKNLHFHIDQAGKGVLHHAAINNWTDVLHRCFTCAADAGADIHINQIDHAGRTALHLAAGLGNTAACQILVRHGASLKLQDRNGRTAAHEAADTGFKDTLMALLQSERVDVNQRDHLGRNLVHWAATLDCVDVMRLVVKVPGAEIARRDKYGVLPIAIANTCRSANVGKFLAAEMERRGVERIWYLGYDWDGMYNSATVASDDEDDDEAIRLGAGGGTNDLLYRLSQRQKMLRSEWRAVHEAYPPELWALVRPGHHEGKPKDFPETAPTSTRWSQPV